MLYSRTVPSPEPVKPWSVSCSEEEIEDEEVEEVRHKEKPAFIKGLDHLLEEAWKDGDIDLTNVIG